MTDIEHSAESYETPPRMTKSPVIAPDAPTKSAIPLVLATKRHRHEMDPAMMTFNHAMRRNYNRPAFNRLRDRIGCKAATSDCSVVFNALYQSVIDRLVFNSMLIADNARKSTITNGIVENAHESALSSSRKKIYTDEFIPKKRRIEKSNNDAKETTTD